MGKRGSIRFDNLIAQAGQPKPVTLWSAPERDADFMSAVKASRIVTICQPNTGNVRDYGFVGFFKDRNVSYLLFPKRIPAPPDTKVIGIKYEKLAPSRPRGPRVKSSPKRPLGIPLRENRAASPPPSGSGRPHPAPPTKPPRKEKPLLTFTSEVELIGKQVVPIQVQAKSISEAKTLLKRQAQQVQFAPDAAQISRKIRSIKKVP